MAVVTLRYWAAAQQAAGTAEEVLEAVTVAEALDVARSRRGDPAPFDRVLARSSLLVSGVPAGTRDRGAIRLADGDTVEVLPPFAGG